DALFVSEKRGRYAVEREQVRTQPASARDQRDERLLVQPVRAWSKRVGELGGVGEGVVADRSVEALVEPPEAPPLDHEEAGVLPANRIGHVVADESDEAAGRN